MVKNFPLFPITLIAVYLSGGLKPTGRKNCVYC